MYDKAHQKEHFKVNHPEMSKMEIEQVFENTYLEFEQTKHIKRVLGYNHKKQFLVLIVVFNQDRTQAKLITAYRAKRQHIILYLKEVKNEKM